MDSPVFGTKAGFYAGRAGRFGFVVEAFTPHPAAPVRGITISLAIATKPQRANPGKTCKHSPRAATAHGHTHLLHAIGALRLTGSGVEGPALGPLPEPAGPLKAPVTGASGLGPLRSIVPLACFQGGRKGERKKNGVPSLCALTRVCATRSETALEGFACLLGRLVPDAPEVGGGEPTYLCYLAPSNLYVACRERPRGQRPPI